MAFKINKEIVTSKGVTNEAYVRIEKYEIDKIGKAIFKIGTYLNKQSVVDALETPHNPEMAIIHEVGEHIHLWLQKDVEVKRTEMETVVVDTPEVKDEIGMIITPASRKYEQKEVEKISKKKVPDLSSVENGTIFEYGYARLKEKLAELYGEENIEVC